MQAETVISRCRHLGQFSEEPDQIKRTFLSPAMRDCMREVQAWMEAAGMQVKIDPAGNLRGRYAGASNTSLMIGSHLDTVPNSGAFDGILGVMLGLALVESLDGERLPFSIELVAFSEEEGVRFHLPFIGSRALVGRADSDFLAATDGDGISIAQALTSFGLDPLKIKDCEVGAEVAGFLEFHIEQGILLESEDRSLGVVQAIVGQTRAEMTFTGRARHAGTTPMRLRNDAVAGAAEWVVAVERLALDTPGLVGTVGDLRTHPGAGNVVAGQLRASLDVRHEDDSIRHQSVRTLLAQADSIAKRRGLSVASKMLMDQPAVPMDRHLCYLAAEAIRDTGIEPLSMVSGAGHDAMILAERVPTTMIFLRSPGGISHHPEESVRPQDVQNALAAGRAFLRLMTKVVSKEQSV
ncbi:MAG: allantoate deiminase [Acidobacteriaceae bacterium]|nr:allantoate deiminase [Acidobacteriaceae bacterium]